MSHTNGKSANPSLDLHPHAIQASTLQDQIIITLRYCKHLINCPRLHDVKDTYQ